VEFRLDGSVRNGTVDGAMRRRFHTKSGAVRHALLYGRAISADVKESGVRV